MIRANDLILIQGLSWICLSLLLTLWTGSMLLTNVADNVTPENGESTVWSGEIQAVEKWMWLVWLSGCSAIVSFGLSLLELAFICCPSWGKWVMRVRLASRMIMCVAVLEAVIVFAETLAPPHPDFHRTVILARVGYFFACGLTIVLLGWMSVWEELSLRYARERELELAGQHYTFLVDS